MQDREEAIMVPELSPDQLRWVCEPDICTFDDTSKLDELPERIGQNRALRALDFGVGIQSHGYNIYALGPSGTGRMTAITNILSQTAEKMPVPDDWCYVYNFDDAHRPLRRRPADGYARLLPHVDRASLSRRDATVDRVAATARRDEQLGHPVARRLDDVHARGG